MIRSDKAADGRTTSVSSANDPELRLIYNEIRRIRTILSEGTMDGPVGVSAVVDIHAVDLKVLLEKTMGKMERNHVAHALPIVTTIHEGV